MSLFHTKTQETERERNSVFEVFTILQSVCQMLQHRTEVEFLSLKTLEVLSKRKERCTTEIRSVYESSFFFVQIVF
jgi:hypothetical protein